MNLLEQVGLAALMRITHGRPEVSIALIDGPVDTKDPRFTHSRIRSMPTPGSTGENTLDRGFEHGTFLAAALVGANEDGIGSTGGMRQGCTLLVRPIFGACSDTGLPSADAVTLASAIVDAVEAGATVINLSLSAHRVGRQGSAAIADALDFAAARGSIVVAASGNEGQVGCSPLLSHSWVIPVVACDEMGSLMPFSNIGRSVGRHGLGAPGASSFAAGGSDAPERIVGTSVAAVFVTAAAALLSSVFPGAEPADVVRALRDAAGRRRTVVPPLLDARAACERLASSKCGGRPLIPDEAADVSVAGNRQQRL